MSYMFSASSSFPKVRQEGFHTQSTGGSTPVPGQNTAQSQQSITATNAFDPTSIYSTGALFADAYRATPADPFARRYEQQQQQQQQQNSSLDIHDELSYLNPPTSTTSESFQQQQQQQQRSHDLFGVNQPHYPSVSLPHSRLYPRDDFSSTTPASVHNSYGRAEYFPNGGPQHPTNTGETARHTGEGRQPHELQQQQQQPQSYGMMPSALSNSSAVDSFNPGGEQAPATGVTRSRSRSRSKVSASRSRVSKRPSLPAPPHEEDGESPDSSRAQSITRPSAIVIPGGQQAHHGHHASHSFSSYHTAGTGHPTSPATWGFPGHSAAGEQLFGQSFGGPGSLGPGQSPTTHSGSPPPTGNVDAATKIALANEKRRKRRESHNAVERRRRDNINEKIQELALLLPEEWLEPPSAGGKNGSGGGGATAFGQGPSLAGLLSGTVSGSALGSGGAAAMMDEDSKEVKANKGVILRNSVEYIKNLVQLVQVQRTRNQQLESELAQYRNRFGNVIGGSNGGTGNISLNGSMNQDGISPGGGMQSSNHTDDDTSAMAGYVLADSLNSPEGFDMKAIFGGQTGIGPLDTIGSGGGVGVHGHGNPHGGHAHTLSSGAMSMEGVETSSGQPFGLSSIAASGMMGIGMSGLGGGGPASSATFMQGSHHHQHNNNNNNNMMFVSNNGNGNNGGGLGVSVMMTDKTSPSTGSGEGDEAEDDDVPRGRNRTRFPAGVGKQEDETPVL